MKTRKRTRLDPCKRAFTTCMQWVVISTLIGIVAGIGAIAFYAAIHLTTSFFLDGLVGYRPPDPAGEGQAGVMSFWTAARPWLLPVITTLGGLIAGIIVFTLAPEAEGHGTDAAIGKHRASSRQRQSSRCMMRHTEHSY